MPQLFSIFITKRIMPLAMILLLMLQLLGGGMYFHFQRAHIRKDIKSRIKQGVPQNELKVFHFAKLQELETLNWHNDHEFRQGDEMFDVVRKEVTEHGVYLHCINDQQETLLFAQLNELVKKRSESDPMGRQQLAQSLSSPYLPFKSIHLQVVQWRTFICPVEYTFTLKTWIRDPDSPPPRLTV